MKQLTEYLECQHWPETGMMVCRWLREATPVEMRACYEHLRVTAQGVGSRRWLLDIRRRNNEDLETAQWLRTDFMPRLAAQAGGPSFLAYLLSPAHLGRIDDPATVLPQGMPLQRSVHIAIFIEEGAANAWLVQQAGNG